MAHITHEAAPRHSILAAAANIASGAFEWLASIGENSYRMKEVARLQSMSDDELAERGLTRDRIAHHVFRDVYYV